MVNIIKIVFGILKEEENKLIMMLNLKEFLILIFFILKNVEKWIYL